MLGKIQDRAKKAVSKAMREKVVEVLTELKNCHNWMFRLINGLMIDSKQDDRELYVSESDGKLYFGEKERGNIWKDYKEGIMNEENYWDHYVEGDAVKGPVVCVNREEVLKALNEMKMKNTPGPSEVSLELIAASGV